MRRAALLAAACLLLSAEGASAHVAPGGLTGFFGGALHPYFVPAHLMALLSFGLLNGQQPRGHAMVIGGFAVALVLGLVANIAGMPAGKAEYVVLAAAGVSGALVAIAYPLPQIVLIALAGVAGVALELDSSLDGVDGFRFMLSLAGSAASAIVTALIVTGIASTREQEWQRIGVRVVGSWIAAGALLVLTLRLVRG